LNTLGPKRFYLWAWLLPIGFEFHDDRESMASAASGNSVPAEIIIAIQVILTFTLALFINILFALGKNWAGADFY
jgi:hypothetical protein